MKYKWTHADLANIKPALTDDIADKHRQMVKEAMANMRDTRLFHAPTRTTSSGCFMLHT